MMIIISLLTKKNEVTHVFLNLDKDHLCKTKFRYHPIIISDMKLTMDYVMEKMELKKVNAFTSSKAIIRHNTKYELKLLSILILPSNIEITDTICMDIIIDQIAKPTASLLSAFIKIQLNHGLNIHATIAITQSILADSITYIS